MTVNHTISLGNTKKKTIYIKEDSSTSFDVFLTNSKIGRIVKVGSNKWIARASLYENKIIIDDQDKSILTEKLIELLECIVVLNYLRKEMKIIDDIPEESRFYKSLVALGPSFETKKDRIDAAIKSCISFLNDRKSFLPDWKLPAD